MFRSICRLSVAVLALLLTAPPAPAVIMKLTPLKEVIESEQFIFVAAVDKVDAEKPSVTLAVAAADALKGVPPFERMPINLLGDAEAKKGDHSKLILARLAAGRKVVVFASRKGARYNAMAFVEGTWFSLQGTVDEGDKSVRWAFLHAEPYLRRTFTGTTDELKKVVRDGLDKKAEPPPPNEKEKPGYGPPAAEKKCAAGEGGRAPVPPFAVIPSLALAGPLAILAALFPGVFARLAVAMTRWRAFLVVASINTTLAAIYFALQQYDLLPDWKASRPEALSVALLAVAAGGLVWAGLRYRRMGAEGSAVTAPPARRELAILAAVTVATGLLPVVARLMGYPWASAIELPMREFTFVAVGLAAATAYSSYRAFTRATDLRPDGTEPPLRLSLSGESVGLAALILCGLIAIIPGLSGRGSSAFVAADTVAGEADAAIGPKFLGVRTLEVSDATQVMSDITAAGGRLYFGAVQVTGFNQSGLVVCLDGETGAQVWRFEPDDLRPVFSAPAVADGKVYVGEGLHDHGECRLFCLDAATGKPAWAKPFPTGSHTEGTPRVAGGKVFFSAGDDGLYCADAASGTKRWQAEGKARQRHIDGAPAVAGNRLFAGSALYAPGLLGLDAETGKELWWTPTKLRSFGAPVALGDRVAFGLGTGNLGADTVEYAKDGCTVREAAPAGEVLCVSAADGREVWKYSLAKSVHTSLAADAFSVYATSRDGWVHCLDRASGKLRWKKELGTAITAGAAVALAEGYPVAVYAVSREGRVVCLNPHTGGVVWQKELPGYAWDGQESNGVLSAPAVVSVPTAGGSRRAIYVGAMLTGRNTSKKTAAVFRFDDEVAAER